MGVLLDAAAVNPDKASPWLLTTVAICGASTACLFCWQPIAVPLLLELLLASLFLFRPKAAIKLVLFSSGLPLVLFYEDVGYVGAGTKPLFPEWGGTTPDGLRLIISSFLLCFVLVKLPQTRSLLRRFWPYATMLIFLAATEVYSNAPVEGLRLLLKIAFPFLLALAVAQLLTSSQEADSYARYWVAGGLVASLCGPILLLFKDGSFLFADDTFRYNPGFTSASSYSFYMLALFLFCYMRWRQEHSRAFAALAFIFGVQAILPFTRITWIGLLGSVAIFEFLLMRGTRKWIMTAAVVLLPILFFYTLLWRSPWLQQRVFQSEDVDSDRSLFELVQDVGLTGRGAVWLSELQDYQQHSRLLGQGMGASDRYTMSLFDTVAHNEYLRILYDGGALGLILFLFANGSLLVLLHKFRRSEDTSLRSYSALGIALLCGYLIVAFTDNPLDYYLLFTQYIFFVIGVCVALHQKTKLALKH